MEYVEDFRCGDHTGPLLDCFQEALGHQLPNHLVALQGLARVLEEGEGRQLPPDAREQLGHLATLARNTDRLVRALAEVGRLCRDARVPESAAVAEIARETGAEVNLLYGGPPIVYDFPGDLPVVPVSRQSLGQVLVQLLRNAVRACGPGGQVRTGGRLVEGGLEVWVADDGKGMPSGPPERLLAPFQRGGDGPGLGLFLVRLVTAAWGGRLRLQSEPGRGTRVTLRIPIG